MNTLAETQALCTFNLGPYWFGVTVDRVQEVVRSQPITRVPLSAPAVRGLMNLRGQIVMAVDLRRCLGLPDDGVAPPLMNVILRRSDGPVSLLVDSIGEVRQADASLFEPPPDNLRPPGRGLIHGIYKITDRLLIVLDADRAIEQAVSGRAIDEGTL